MFWKRPVMYKPTFFWRNPHIQTVARGAFRLPRRVAWSSHYLSTFYGDSLKVDRLRVPGEIRHRVLFVHGLTGCSQASPIPEVAVAAREFGVETWALNLRGADRKAPSIPRLYHAGCSEDLEAVFRQLPRDKPWRLVGFSLGANVLLKWLGEQGRVIPGARAMAVSCPYDLRRCSEALEKSLVTRFYRAVLVHRLKMIMRIFFRAHPGVIDSDAVRRVRTFFDFDEVITAPLHGFEGALDYWNRCSSEQFLKGIKVPSVLLHALDDPFLGVPPVQVESEYLDWEVTRFGGHLGFQESWGRDWLVERLLRFVYQ